jgi:alkylhydroperoxidase domain protein/CMD domain protein
MSAGERTGGATAAEATDVIGRLGAIATDIAALRRPITRQQSQASHDALFDPVDDAAFSRRERQAVAAFVTRLTADDATAAYYAAGPDPLVALVVAEAERHTASGPYGVYPEAGLAGESAVGPRYEAGPEISAAVGPRLTAALEYGHLVTYRPRETTGADHGRLLAAGWSLDGIVTLAQLVAFLAFQQRAATGLRVLSGGAGDAGDAGGALAGPYPEGAGDVVAGDSAVGGAAVGGAAAAGPAVVVATHDERRPEAFTRDEIGWLPWLPALPIKELTQRHKDGLVDEGRAKSDYFRLLARDPEVLGARTRTDNDIFYTKGGLPRAERELAAAATSRVNGCVFCASVHARFAAHYSRRPEDVDRLLARGLAADLGPRWNAIVAGAKALTVTPVAFGPGEVGRLREAGLADDEIIDVIHASAFFNWANRLMLTLGRPAT